MITKTSAIAKARARARARARTIRTNNSNINFEEDGKERKGGGQPIITGIITKKTKNNIRRTKNNNEDKEGVLGEYIEIK